MSAIARSCDRCSQSFIRLSNAQKFCAECRPSVQRDRVLERSRLRRPIGVTRNETYHRVGQSHGRAKLTDEQVRKMRRMYRRGLVGYEALAETFACGASTVRDIVNFQTRVCA